MGKKDKNFDNPNPMNVLLYIKALSELNKFIITNDLSGHFKAISDNLKEIKNTASIIADISTILKSCETLESSTKKLIDTISSINEYVKVNLDDFYAVDRIKDILRSFTDIFTSDLDSSHISENITKSGRTLSSAIMNILTDIYMIGNMVDANSEHLSNMLDNIIGDNTSSYIALMKNDYSYLTENNTSILYRYFLLSGVLQRLSENKVKMNWFKQFIYFNFTIKSTINHIFKTISYFYKKIKKLNKLSEKESSELISNSIIMNLNMFMTFLDNLVNKDMSIKSMIILRVRLFKLFHIYKKFIKSVIKISKKFNFDELNLTDVVSPIKDFTQNMMDATQIIEIASNIGFLKLWKARKKINKIYNQFIKILIGIGKKVNVDDIEKNIEIISSVNDLCKTLIEVVENLQIIKFSNRDKKEVFNTFSTIREILYVINKIKYKNAQENAEVINSIFENILLISQKINKIALSTIFLLIFEKVFVPSFLRVISILDGIKIKKNTVKNINDLTEILSEIQSIISKFSITLGLLGAFSWTVLLGVMIAIASITMLITGFVFIAIKLKKYKKQIKSTKNLLLEMMASVAAFVMAIAKLTISAAIILVVIVLLAAVAAFVAEYIGISKIIVKFKKYITDGEKLLSTMSATILAFFKSIEIVTTAIFGTNASAAKKDTKNTPSVLLSMLVIAATVAAIIGIFFMLSRVKKVVAPGTKLLLFIAGVLLSFIGILVLLSYVTITINSVISFALLFIAGTIASIVLICLVLDKTKKYIIPGLLVLLELIVTFGLIALGLYLIYSAISSITNWAAFGFLFANIGAMAVSAAAIGAVIMLTAGLGAAAIAAGVVAMIGISASFILIGRNIASLYDSLPQITAEQSEERMKVFLGPLNAVTEWVRKTDWKTILWLPTGTKALKKASDNLAKIINNFSGDESKVNNFNKAIDSYVRFVDKLNTVKLENLQTATNMFEKMAEFSKSISGNFEGLADAINDKIMPLLEQLNEGLNKTNENIENGSFGSAIITSGPAVSTSVSTGIPTTGIPTTGTATNTPPKDYSRILNEIKQEITKVQKTLTDGSQRTTVDSSR